MVQRKNKDLHIPALPSEWILCRAHRFAYEAFGFAPKNDPFDFVLREVHPDLPDVRRESQIITLDFLVENLAWHLKLVTKIKLMNNRLEQIPDEFFSTFPNLKMLNLSSNRLTRIPNGELVNSAASHWSFILHKSSFG